MSEILVTGHSVESYAAVSSGSVFQRNRGNLNLESEELVDTHFSERGRQGRLMMIAMNTGQRWAFGVDEDAAYLWRPDDVYEIVGEAMRDGTYSGENTSHNPSTYHLVWVYFMPRSIVLLMPLLRSRYPWRCRDLQRHHRHTLIGRSTSLLKVTRSTRRLVRSFGTRIKRPANPSACLTRPTRYSTAPRR